MKSGPLCRCCGKPIPKRTVNHYPKPGHGKLPRSKEDCQRLTNHKVVSVSYHEDTPYMREKGFAGTVERFSTWDGESYTDDLFCKTACAEAFGRMAATLDAITTKAYVAAMKRRRQ